jgi:hypothetical protein
MTMTYRTCVSSSFFNYPTSEPWQAAWLRSKDTPRPIGLPIHAGLLASMYIESDGSRSRRWESALVGMEARGSAHYWALELRSMGHTPVLNPPTYVKQYVKRGKNDAVDAEAVCEAMSGPQMRFVSVKSPEQQATLVLRTT